MAVRSLHDRLSDRRERDELLKPFVKFVLPARARRARPGCFVTHYSTNGNHRLVLSAEAAAAIGPVEAVELYYDVGRRRFAIVAEQGASVPLRTEKSSGRRYLSARTFVERQALDEGPARCLPAKVVAPGVVFVEYGGHESDS